jgi:hypothetical protein
MLFGFPLVFAQHLDAGAVVHQVQACRCQLHSNRHHKIFLTPADGTQIGHLPIQASAIQSSRPVG